MRSIFFFLFISIVVFKGCSTKQVEGPSPQEENKETIELAAPAIDIQKSDSEDVSEFEDEFQDETQTREDPLKEYNELMTNFNDKMITYALNPVSEAYAYVIPEPFLIGISNAFHNIQFPIRFTNNLLQGKFTNVLDETNRFLINSTIGLLGFMDPAKEHMQIYAHECLNRFPI